MQTKANGYRYIRLSRDSHLGKKGSVAQFRDSQADQYVEDKFAVECEQPDEAQPKRARRVKGSGIENKSMNGRGAAV